MKKFPWREIIAVIVFVSGLVVAWSHHFLIGFGVCLLSPTIISGFFLKYRLLYYLFFWLGGLQLAMYLGDKYQAIDAAVLTFVIFVWAFIPLEMTIRNRLEAKRKERIRKRVMSRLGYGDPKS